MNDRQRQTLIQVARSAVAAALRGERTPPIPIDDEDLLQRRGVFVSIHVAGELRGCIGVVVPRDPIVEAVMDCAVSAATSDLRFAPLVTDEIDAATFEISILSAPRRVGRPDEVEIGRHGIIVTRGARRGLLLPQVAVEHDLGREEFLDAACRKAGLPDEAWRGNDVSIEVFSAEVFGEGPAAA